MERKGLKLKPALTDLLVVRIKATAKRPPRVLTINHFPSSSKIFDSEQIPRLWPLIAIGPVAGLLCKSISVIRSFRF